MDILPTRYWDDPEKLYRDAEAMLLSKKPILAPKTQEDIDRLDQERDIALQGIRDIVEDAKGLIEPVKRASGTEADKRLLAIRLWRSHIDSINEYGTQTFGVENRNLEVVDAMMPYLRPDDIAEWAMGSDSRVMAASVEERLFSDSRRTFLDMKPTGHAENGPQGVVLQFVEDEAIGEGRPVAVRAWNVATRGDKNVDRVFKIIEEARR